jgi:hypothetical protein
MHRPDTSVDRISEEIRHIRRLEVADGFMPAERAL